MDVYLARQPIFDVKCQVVGYELLYRDDERGDGGNEISSEKATCRLLSDAITGFGLPKLTNEKPAYINFTDTLLLNDFVRLAKPEEVVVEIMEDVQVTTVLMEKLMALKNAGYRLALNDYTGERRFHKLLPVVDTVKVDFRLNDLRRQREIALDLRQYQGVSPLAEGVESWEEFEQAAKMGFRMFQGNFFAQPATLTTHRDTLVASSCTRLLMELNNPNGVDFRNCANIIRSDVTLTYRLMCMVQRLAYYRGNLVTGIQQALVLVGVDELRRWTLLSMARDNNVSRSDELIRAAFLRGAFAKRLMAATPHEEEDAEQGFLLGMFSMLDQIMGVDMPDLLADLELPPRMTEALLGEGDGEDFYCHLLQYVERYEARRGEPLPEDVAPGMSEREVSRLYMDSMVETDQTFNGMEEEAS